MAVKAERVGSELVEAVLDRIREELDEDEAALCEPFVREYYRWVPPEDLARRSEPELYGAAVAHWRLALVRAAGRDEAAGAEPDARAGRLGVAADGGPDRVGRHAVHRRLGDDRARPRGAQHRPRDPPGDQGQARCRGADDRGARARRRGARLLARVGADGGARARAGRGPARAARRRDRARPGRGPGDGRGLASDARQDARPRRGAARGRGSGRVPEVGRRRSLHVPGPTASTTCSRRGAKSA